MSTEKDTNLVTPVFLGELGDLALTHSCLDRPWLGSWSLRIDKGRHVGDLLWFVRLVCDMISSDKDEKSAKNERLHHHLWVVRIRAPYFLSHFFRIGHW